MYDCAIIGTGPAGVSAALNLKIRNKNFIWLGSRNLSDKITLAEKINNYPGLPAVSGRELNEAFRRHVEEMGIEITEQMVNSIMPFGDHYALMAGPEFYEAKTVILTTGIANVGTLEHEEEFMGRGVSYCATCDGMLYRGRTIAVICGNPRFEHEVKYLADLAEKVYFLPKYKDAQPMADNVELIPVRPAAVRGSDLLEAVVLKDGTELAVDGLFCLRDSVALNTLLPGLAAEEGHITVDRHMATNLPGIFAAGDCTGRPYQYTKAVGEGNIAAHSVLDYLAQAEKTEE